VSSQLPIVTVAVPSLNQSQFLDEALASIFEQSVPVEVFVADGGSSDGSLEVIKRWSPRLAGWRSHRDDGQSAAINESIHKGTAPYVMWLNSDDMLLPGALSTLTSALERETDASVAYGQAWRMDEASGRKKLVWTEPFSDYRLSIRCIISQPAAIIRRASWERVGGLDSGLHMAMDYDLWWRLSKSGAKFLCLSDVVAVNRLHSETKTRLNRARHYSEATSIVKRYNGRLPMKWWLWRPYSVWAKHFFPRLP